MFLAQRGVPPLGLVVATVVGGTLSAGSANALNCVYDADIDERMRRTRRRALPRHIVSTRAALVFGLVLGVVSTLLLGFLVNWLSASLAAGGERVLRRRLHDDPQAPDDPEHRLGRSGRLLPRADRLDGGRPARWPGRPSCCFMVVFFWTPPHFWALAIRYREDYAAAEVPMLPGRGRRQGRRPSDRRLLLRDGGDLAAALAGRRDGLVLPDRGRAARSGVPRRVAPAAGPGRRQRRRGRTSSRCGSSTGRTCTSRCSSSAVALDPLLNF